MSGQCWRHKWAGSWVSVLAAKRKLSGNFNSGPATKEDSFVIPDQLFLTEKVRANLGMGIDMRADFIDFWSGQRL